MRFSFTSPNEPSELEIAAEDVGDDGYVYVVDKTYTVAIHDVAVAAGYDGVYRYDWVGAGSPHGTTPLPSELPSDAVVHTLYGGEAGGEYSEVVSPAPVPSLSEWGVVSLTLLLVSAAMRPLMARVSPRLLRERAD